MSVKSESIRANTGFEFCTNNPGDGFAYKKHGHNNYEQNHKTYKRAFDEILE